MSVALLTRPASTTALRIGMLSESYLPRISGVVHSLTAFVGALRERGHRVFVVAPVYPGYADTEPDIIRLPSVRLPHEPDFPLANLLSPASWRMLQTLDVDVVHTHSPFLMGRAGARVARRRKIPLVFTHHTLYDEYLHYVPWIGAAVSRPAVRRYVARYANRCDLVIAPSSVVASRLRAHGVHSRIEVLPTGVVDTGLIASLDPSWVRPVFGIPEGRTLLVTASRLGKEKSVDLLLEMFANVVQRREAVLLIVGGGPEDGALKEQAVRLGVAERVIFAGPQPHKKTLECMAASDIFVFASQTETQGLAVIEAIAVGRPVVAVAAGGVTDAVRGEDTGVLSPASAAAMADRVVALIDDPARRGRLAERAREAAYQFSLEAAADRLSALYRSLLPVPHR